MPLPMQASRSLHPRRANEVVMGRPDHNVAVKLTHKKELRNLPVFGRVWYDKDF